MNPETPPPDGDSPATLPDTGRHDHPHEPPVPSGQEFAGYVVEAVAGRGGMGTVYRAWESELDRPVALKVMAPALNESTRYRAMFEEEARRAAGLEHPNVLPVYRAGQYNGQLYLSMRFVDGLDLHRLVAARGRLSLGAVITIVGAVADALDAAHARGVVHRDVKPSNVLIAGTGADEHVYLADFGLAASLGSANQIIPSGGTPGFGAPEQMHGGSVGTPADVYGLARVTFFALTGRLPEAGPLPRVAELVPALAGCEVDAVLQRGTAPDPADRYPTASAFADALAALRREVVLLHDQAGDAAAAELKGRLEHHGLTVRTVDDRADADAIAAARALVLVVDDDRDGAWLGGFVPRLRDAVADDGSLTLVAVCTGDTDAPLRDRHPALAGIPLVDLRKRSGLGFDDLLRILDAPDRGLSAPSGACPYRGLAAFAEADHSVFVGREGEVGEMLEHLTRFPFLAVLGASGTGKSSVVHAGLVPGMRARDGALRVVSLTPGAAPAAAVGAAMGRPELATGLMRTSDALARALDGPAVLVVDQFEELFTMGSPPAERRAVMDNLVSVATTPARGCTVVITLRSDFYGRCAEHPALRDLIVAHQVLIGPLGPDQVRRAITEPAAAAGLVAEPSLVRRIVGEMQRAPTALPLMGHLLTEVWQRRRGNRLTIDGYEASGGLEGALAQRADDTQSSLAPEEQAVARRVLVRMVRVGEGTDDTRRRVSTPDLALSPADGERVQAVLERFVQARLVSRGTDPVTGAPTAELAHEALIRGWPTLQGWLQDDRAALTRQRHLSDAAHEWRDAGDDPAQLYRGPRLAAWDGQATDDLNPTEIAFLETSRREADARAARQRRRARTLLAGVSGVAVVLGAAAVVTLLARNSAAHDASRARRSSAAALSAETRLALTSGQGDPFTSAQRSYAAAHTPDSEQALRAAAQRPLRRLMGSGASLWAVTPLGDGRVAVGGDDDTVQIWDPRHPEAPRARIPIHQSVYGILRMGPDRLVAVDASGTASLLDTTGAGRVVQQLQVSKDGSLYALAWLGHGRVATGGDDGHITVLDTAGGVLRRVASFPTGGSAVTALAFLTGDRGLASGDDSGVIRVWDLADTSHPRVTQSLPQGHGDITSLVGVDGGRLASGADGYLDLWRLNGDRLDHVDQVAPGAFHVILARVWDGNLAVEGEAGALEVRSPDHLRDVLSHTATGVKLHAVAALPGGDIATASDTGSLQIWDPAVAAEQITNPAELQVAPDGRQNYRSINAVQRLGTERLVSLSGVGRLTYWRTQPTAHAVWAVRNGHNKMVALAVRPDGTVVTGDEHGHLALWAPRPASSPHPHGRREGHHGAGAAARRRGGGGHGGRRRGGVRPRHARRAGACQRPEPGQRADAPAGRPVRHRRRCGRPARVDCGRGTPHRHHHASGRRRHHGHRPGPRGAPRGRRQGGGHHGGAHRRPRHGHAHRLGPRRRARAHHGPRRGRADQRPRRRPDREVASHPHPHRRGHPAGARRRQRAHVAAQPAAGGGRRLLAAHHLSPGGVPHHRAGPLHQPRVAAGEGRHRGLRWGVNHPGRPPVYRSGGAARPPVWAGNVRGPAIPRPQEPR
ncbi:MAG: serine/threonine-protein kinase [Thermoleophilia bacterium]